MAKNIVEENRGTAGGLQIVYIHFKSIPPAQILSRPLKIYPARSKSIPPGVIF